MNGLFMSLVGPGGSGKTRLIFAMRASPITFYPPITKTYYFYKEYQPLFKEMSKSLILSSFLAWILK